MEEKKIHRKHSGVRTFLRIAGPAALIGGVWCLYKGLSAFGDFERAFSTTPIYMFAGIGLLFVGLVMTAAGFLGAAARYQAAEVAPVAKDTFNYLAEGTQEGVKTVASAIGEGLAEGAGRTGPPPPPGAAAVVVRCHKCNADNEPGDRFCGQCGAALGKTRPCTACGELNDPDARFCDNCGAAFEPKA